MLPGSALPFVPYGSLGLVSRRAHSRYKAGMRLALLAIRDEF